MDEKQIQKEERELILWQVLLASIFGQPFEEILEDRLKEV